MSWAVESDSTAFFLIERITSPTYLIDESLTLSCKNPLAYNPLHTLINILYNKICCLIILFTYSYLLHTMTNLI